MFMNDAVFKSLSQQLNDGFREFVEQRSRFIETNFGQLFTALYAGRLDTTGEQFAVPLLRKSSPNHKAPAKYVELASSLHPEIEDLAAAYDVSRDLIIHTLLASASCERTNPLDKVLTLSAAAKEFNKDESTIRKALHAENSKFCHGEWRKQGGTTLVLRTALERVYGKGGYEK